MRSVIDKYISGRLVSSCLILFGAIFAYWSNSAALDFSIVVIASTLAVCLLPKATSGPNQSSTKKSKVDDSQLNELLDGISTSIGNELSFMKSEVDRIKGLVASAVVELQGAFEGLNGNIAVQQDLVMGILQSMSSDTNDSGKIGFKDFATETDEILQFFVGQSISISKDSMDMMHRIDDMSNQMEEVVSMLKTIKTIAEKTNLLALNADIEAAKAGDAGRGFAVVASEVRSLAQMSRKFSDEIGKVVSGSRENIDQAKEVMGSIASKDMTIAIKSKTRVDDMVAELSGLNDFVSEQIGRVADVTGKINNSVGVAVRSLQFEDMVRQLVQHLGRRVMLIDTFVDSLSEERRGLLDSYQHDPEAFLARLKDVHSLLKEQEELFASVQHNAVDQESMTEGEVVLF